MSYLLQSKHIPNKICEITIFFFLKAHTELQMYDHTVISDMIKYLRNYV